jgi:hypothetical protein
MSTLLRTAVRALCVVQLLAGSPGFQPQTAPAPVSAKTWLGREKEIEEYLKTAEVVKMTTTSVGVTKPRHTYLAPGGPVSEMAFKALPERMESGFRESYKCEIAAYELDKLLQLGMVPPKVERTIKNEIGVAVMWASPTKSFKDLGGPPTAPPQQAFNWSRQLMKAKMFHNLIGDLDPNLGNWLVDPAWNLILIDHSRAFTTTKSLVHVMEHIDRPLWDRINALTEAEVAAALGPWLAEKDQQAIFQRRAAMQKAVEKLVKSKGEAAVFVK